MSDIERLEEECDQLRRELLGTQEMLGLVLMSTGPVEVTLELMNHVKQNGWEGRTIGIDQNLQRDTFEFYIAEPESLSEQ